MYRNIVCKTWASKIEELRIWIYDFLKKNPKHANGPIPRTDISLFKRECCNLYLVFVGLIVFDESYRNQKHIQRSPSLTYIWPCDSTYLTINRGVIVDSSVEVTYSRQGYCHKPSPPPNLERATIIW